MAMAGLIPLNVPDSRFIEPVQELSSVGGKRLHVAPLTFRVEGVEGEAGFPGSAHAGNHGQPVRRDVDVDVLQIVLSSSQNPDEPIVIAISAHKMNSSVAFKNPLKGEPPVSDLWDGFPSTHFPVV